MLFWTYICNFHSKKDNRKIPFFYNTGFEFHNNYKKSEVVFVHIIWAWSTDDQLNKR